VAAAIERECLDKYFDADACDPARGAIPPALGAVLARSPPRATLASPRGTRRVQLVRGEGRGVSTSYEGVCVLWRSGALVSRRGELALPLARR
jgi:hypothetical protein